MLPEELDHWAATLRQRRQELEAALRARGPSAALAGPEADELRAIDAALQRIASATFGHCTRCGLAISAGRLAAQPSAAMCLACQEAQEQQRSFLLRAGV